MAETASWQRPATLDDSENAMDDSENAFAAAPAWETCKENSMPRKSGRKAAAFGTERPAEVADEREQRRAQWELELSDTSDPNPLNTWWSCIKWTQEEYPKGGKDAKGRYTASVGGKALCWDWNRAADGCQATCPNGRAHVCEWCLGEHRAVDHPAGA